MKNFLFIILAFFTISLNAQNALDFNGNNWVVTDPIGTLGDFTIEMDIRIDGSGTGTNYQRILSTINNGLSIAVDPLSGNNIRIFSSNLGLGWSYTPVNLTTNQWYHMAWVKQGSLLTLYIDASNVWSIGCSGSLASSNWFLAANENNFSENSNCTIDNFRLWNDARTSTEISENYQSCVSSSEANLITLYDFEEGTGTSTSDLATTDGSQNGTLTGSPQWSLEGFSCKTTQAMLAGDIAIIGINSDNFSASVRDDFTFITLKEIPAGEVIYFTADGWGGTNWVASSGGGHYSWTAPAGGLGCGTIVHVYMTSTLNVLASSIGSISGPYSGLPASNYLLYVDGDQILMYQASSPGDMNPTFITGVTFCSDNTNYNATTSWNNITPNAPAYSLLPLGLTNGMNCVSLYPNPSTTNSGLDNSKYTGTLSGDASTLRALINDYTNWSGNDLTPYDISALNFPTPSVICSPPCTDPDVPTVTASTQTICPGGSTTLNWAGANLNDATAWHVYTTSCGSGQLTSQTGTSLVVSPATTTTYYIRGEDGAGCVDESTGVCGSVTVFVSDVTPPTITCPGNQTGNVSASCSFTLPDYTGLATASDNCTASPTITQSPVPGTTVGVGTTVVTLTANDGNGNTANCNFSVVVSDVTNPVITCPGNQTETPDASCQFMLPDYTGLATATDNCTALPTVTQSPVPGTVITGNTTITLTATDGSSNSANCTFDVLLVDGTAPTAVCQNITSFLDGAGNATITAADIDGGSTDNCGGVTLSVSQTSFTCADIGANNVTLTVTDGNSNTANCVAVVTVLDTSSPTVVCQNITVFLDNSGLAVITPNDIDNGTTDNCGAITLMTSMQTFTCSEVGPNNVTLTATDASGNSSNCVAVVTVIDTISPVITCPGSQTGEPTTSCQFILPDYTGLATANDNCGSVTVTQSPVAGTAVGLGNTTITLTAIDGSSNVSTCTFDVAVSSSITGSVTNTICNNDSIEVNGTFYNASNPAGTEVMMAANGCDSTVTINLTVEAAIDVTVDNTLMPTLTANQAGATYQWVDCDNANAPIAGATSQSYVATANGNYAVEVTVNGCTETSSCEAVTGVGIAEAKEGEVSIYPNPTSGLVMIDLPSNAKANNYTVLAIDGKVVAQGKVLSNRLTIDLSEESKGIYFLQLQDETSSKVYKVLKQ